MLHDRKCSHIFPCFLIEQNVSEVTASFTFGFACSHPSHKPSGFSRALSGSAGAQMQLYVCQVSATAPPRLCYLPFQAIDSIHQVGVYCLALVPANTLPKAPLGGIHISETKQRFLEGMLHPCNVLMCPHTCVTNLPKPRQKQPG